MPTPKLTAEITAIEGFEFQKRRIDDQIAELRSMLPGASPGDDAATPETPARKRKKFSAASRRKMALAQKSKVGSDQGNVTSHAQASKAKTPDQPGRYEEDHRHQRAVGIETGQSCETTFVEC